jgi:hypothetical protein
MLPSIKLFFILIAIIIFTMELIGCSNKTSEDGQGENTMSSKALIEVLKEHNNELMSITGVVGVAQGLCDKKPCIKVFVIEMTAELDKKIPKNLNGYSVSVEETGLIKARPKNKK